MTQTYVYFVKCPGCEDEPFDFFDEAKAYAMNCLTQKPVITQMECCHNDNGFGERVGSNDLGVVWSWEDMMQDVPTEDELTVFSKADTIDCDDDFFNCDFDNLDMVPDNYIRPERTVTPMVAEAYEGAYSTDFNDTEKVSKDMVATAIEAGKEVTIDLGDWEANPQEVRFSDGGVYSNSVIRAYKYGDTEYIFDIWHRSDDGDDEEGRDYYEEYTSFDELWETIADYVGERAVDTVVEARKPVPADMTIESLVEEMEENEDTVECKSCNELFDKESCIKDPKKGWICEACASSSLEESVITEGVYDFPYLVNDPEAKAKIIDELRKNPDTARYIVDDSLRKVRYGIADAFHYNGARDYGVITDFNITEDGTITVSHEAPNGRESQLTLEKAIRDASKKVNYNYARNLLVAIKDIAGNMNKANRPTAAERRAERAAIKDATVLGMLQSEPAAAEEFRKHITSIRFSIPLGDYEYDVDHNDPDAERALARLNKTRDDFLALPFARDAIAKGMVDDRLLFDDDGNMLENNYAWVAAYWYGSCSIKLDCQFKELSPAAQAIYTASKNEAMATNRKVTTDPDDPKAAKKKKPEELDRLEGYVLAKALITHFDNDVEFFKHAPATESLAESDYEVRSVLTACPECGMEEAYDHRGGFCTCCGFSI
jgi:hypothetical protein